MIEPPKPSSRSASAVATPLAEAPTTTMRPTAFMGMMPTSQFGQRTSSTEAVWCHSARGDAGYLETCDVVGALTVDQPARRGVWVRAMPNAGVGYPRPYR